MTTQELTAFRYFELNNKLNELTTNVQKCLLSASNITLTEVKNQVIDYISPNTRCESVEELLFCLQPFCSIFNVNPLKCVAEKFLAECEIMGDFDDYSKNLNEFAMSTKLRHLAFVMSNIQVIQPISSQVRVMLRWNLFEDEKVVQDIIDLVEKLDAAGYGVKYLTLVQIIPEGSLTVLIFIAPYSFLQNISVQNTHAISQSSSRYSVARIITNSVEINL
jgi:hypothetical protein